MDKKDSSISTTNSKKTSGNDESLPLAIFGAPWRFALGTGVLVSLILLIWSFTARIPIRVQGLGVLFPIGTSNRFTTNSYGRVHLLFGDWDSEENKWFKDHFASIKRLKYLDGPESVELAEVLLTNLNEAKLARDAKNKQQYQSISYPYKVYGPALLMYAESPEQSSNLLNAVAAYVAASESYKNITVKQNRLESILTTQKRARKKLQDDLQKLSDIGFISKPQLLANMASIDSLEAQTSDLDVQTSKLKSELSQALGKLKMALNNFIQSTMVISDIDSYVQQVSIGSGDYSPPNVQVILYSKNNEDYPGTIPVFFSARSVSQIAKGNIGYATPLGYPRSQVGGIKLTVSDASQLSAVQSQIESKLGLSGFSQTIGENFASSTMVIVSLARNKSPNAPSPYMWSIKPNLSSYPKVKLGDQFEVEIQTRTQTPITFVMPFLNQLFGKEPPEMKLVSPSSSE